MPTVEHSSACGANARLLDGNRLYLQHGPINLLISANGDAAQVSRAYDGARQVFADLLAGLSGELTLLRQPLDADDPQTDPTLRSPTAGRMLRAVAPYRRHWVTPMAAVAGAVADTVAAAMADCASVDKLYVNNGGDIALRLAPGQSLDVGIVASLRAALPQMKLRISADDKLLIQVQGIATSGWGGRSLSLGIADAVTVLAANAAAADAAATLIANAVNIEHPAIQRRPADELDPDSDLGKRLVTTHVPSLPPPLVAAALDNGVTRARQLIASGEIAAVLLATQQQWRNIGASPETIESLTNEPVCL